MKSALTPLDFLSRSAFVYGDKIAEVDGARSLTYSQFHQRTHRLATALRQLGVDPGDRVAVLAPNTPVALECHFGVPLASAVLVMLDTRLRASELAWILNHCGAKVLIADPQLLPMVSPVLDGQKHLIYVTDDYEGLLQKAQAPFQPVPPEEEQLICINYTSGTTGVPKGVMYSHRGAYLNALAEVMEHGLNSNSVYLWTLPMFHCNGWCFPWAVTAAGGRHVCLRTPEASRIVELIRRESVTHLSGSPLLVGQLSEYCIEHGIQFDHDITMVVAGAAPSPSVLRAAEDIGVEVSHVYGLTEVYGPHSICAWRQEWDKLPAFERARLRARQGVPYTAFGMDMRVVDSGMRDVPSDGIAMGEVVMRGNNVMLGYYKNPDATTEAFRGGWFHSGDMAVMHPDGYIELKDRVKDIVVSGGENVCSIEVEAILREHPAVREVAVVAFPDATWSEVPKAYVELKPNSEVQEEDLIAFCRQHLAEFKCPKLVEFGPLPRTATGKVRKNELRERGWSEAHLIWQD